MPIAGQNNISTIFTYLLANHVYAVPRATAECILSSMVTNLVLLVITATSYICLVVLFVHKLGLLSSYSETLPVKYC